jgi:hypothetical protein
LKADWTEDFAGGAPSQPWITIDDSGNFPADATHFDTSSGRLELVADFEKQQQGEFDLFAVALVGWREPQYSFTDVVVRGTVFAVPGHNVAGQVALGNNDSFLLARMNEAGNSGYVFNLDYDSGDIDLVRAENAPAGIIGLVGATVPNFDPGLDYDLEFTVNGTTLTGRALRNGVELAAVTFEDSTYASGWSGVGGSVNDTADPPGLTTIAVGFDNISSTAIVIPPNWDITGDQRVTRDDIAAFALNFGKQGGTTFFQGDLDLDGQIDAYDLHRFSTQIVAASPIAPQVAERSCKRVDPDSPSAPLAIAG